MGLEDLHWFLLSSALDVCLELTLSGVSEQSQLTHFLGSQVGFLETPHIGIFCISCEAGDALSSFIAPPSFPENTWLTLLPNIFSPFQTVSQARIQRKLKVIPPLLPWFLSSILVCCPLWVGSQIPMQTDLSLPCCLRLIAKAFGSFSCECDIGPWFFQTF